MYYGLWTVLEIGSGPPDWYGSGHINLAVQALLPLAVHKHNIALSLSIYVLNNLASLCSCAD